MKLRSVAPLLAALLLAAGLATPAGASPETITRASQNILFGPIDFVLGPLVGARSVYVNLQEIDDTMPVRVVYAVPGVMWNGAMVMGGGVLRLFTGLLEFVPGLILIPFEADMDPLYAPAERGDALIDEEFEWATVRVGISYVD